jgi:hypothetical protein
MCRGLDTAKNAVVEGLLSKFVPPMFKRVEFGEAWLNPVKELPAASDPLLLEAAWECATTLLKNTDLILSQSAEVSSRGRCSPAGLAPDGRRRTPQ